MKKWGLERQTLAMVLIPTLIFVLLLEGYFVYTRIGDLDRGLGERAKLIARQLASASEYAVFSGNRSLLQQQVDLALAQPDVGAVAVLDATGAVLSRAGDPQDSTEWLVSPAARASPLWDNGKRLVLSQPIVATQIALDEDLGSASKPLGEVVLSISKSRLNSEKTEMVFFNVLFALLTIALALAISLRVSRRITEPVMGMRGAVRRIGEGHLDTRIGETHVQELDDLAQGINDMTLQLQQQRDTLQQRIEEATVELRAKKEEAEQANFDKTRFLAAASHDLRQPMHAMGLFIGELYNRIDTPEQRKIIAKVEESVEAMSSLLDSLLDISKLDAGVVVPQVQAVDVAALLHRLAGEFSSLAAKKSITLRVHALPAFVMSDPILLERSIVNLLGNAIRYVPPHGAVLLACRRRGGALRIEVRDNGPGIPQAEHRNVFREFVQLSNTARDRSKGLGLGLAIVERLSRLLQHPLELRSAPQRGSTFAISVPCISDAERRPSSVLASPAGQRAGEFSGLRVLVVEDDALVREGASGLLSAWGCQVVQAGNLAEVRQLCDEGGSQFDLVICDYRLPDGNGLELTECISHRCIDKPAFILVSGDTSPALLQEMVAQGHHLLHKPVRPAKLRSMMAYVLKRQE